MERIAPPDLVVSDGGSGFEAARKRHWSQSVPQRCTFHVFCTIKKATTTHPKLQVSVELFQLAQRLLKITTIAQAENWIEDWYAWYVRWEEFLDEKTQDPNGRWEDTHKPVVSARNSVKKLINNGMLFAYLDPHWDKTMLAMNNQIEGATNAPLRQMLPAHRGMSLSRRITAIFWWCYMHIQNPLPAAQLLKIMPTDTDIEKA